MKNKEFFRAVKFTLFSISAGLIQILAFTALTELADFPYWVNYLTALTLSVLWNFTLNRRYTFQSANNVPKAMALVGLYYLIFTPVTTIGGNFLTETLGWNEYFVTVLNMVLNFVTEYLYDKCVVFRGSIDTNRLAK